MRSGYKTGIEHHSVTAGVAVDDDPRTLGFTVAGQLTPAPGTRHCPTCGLEIPLTVGSCPKDGTPITVHGDPGIKLVGNYEFLQFIGAGGMGVIYKAKHPVLNRLVAIKMLHGHLVSDAIIRRFQQEAEAVSSLEHRNIIHVHDYGVSEHNQPYMVMDFVEGKPLSDVLQSQQLTLEAVINIAIQITEGLQHAHDRGVLHRDLKPSNVMVTDFDCAVPEVKIVDFGIAKVLEADKTRMTQTGELIGTPQYMSPEQCRGGTLDARSDIYALGCVMFEAITGKTLFAGHSMVSVIVDQMNTAPRTLQETRPDMNFPGHLEDIVAKILAKDPEDRYQSMSEVAQDLIEVQKVIAQQNAESWSKSRVLNLSKEQRNLFLLLLGSVATLVTVATTSISFIKVIHDSRPTHITRAILNNPIAGKAATIIGIDDANRRKWVKYLDMNKADDELMLSFFDVDTGVDRLDLDSKNITGLSMPKIAMQKSLISLHLEETVTSNADLAHISTLPSLERLYLNKTRVSDDGMKLLGGMSNLSRLTLAHTKVGDAGIRALEKLNLRELDIAYTKVSGNAMDALAKFPLLEKLDLAGYFPRGDKNLAALAGAKNLEWLNLADTMISVEDLEEVAKITSLKKLQLSNCNIEDGAIEILKELPKLKELDLSRTKVNLAMLKELSKITSLEILDLNNSGIDDSLLVSLADLCPNLEVVDLKETVVTEKGVSQLAKMKSLKTIELHDSGVTRSSRESLKKTFGATVLKF